MLLPLKLCPHTCLDALHSANMGQTLLDNALKGATITISHVYLQVTESMQCKVE